MNRMTSNEALNRLENPNSSGTIYKQAAIDAIEKFSCCGYIEEDTDKLLKVINDLPPVQSEQRWVPVTERLPKEDHWLGGSGRQFSDEVLVSVTNYDDEDIWTYISQTIDGEWALELPNHCKIIAWMPLPAPYREGEKK